MKAPLQTNGWFCVLFSLHICDIDSILLILFLLSDCGVFVLQNIQAFFDDTDMAKYGSERSYRNAFDSRVVSAMRQKILALIRQLSSSQVEADAAAAAKTVERT